VVKCAQCSELLSSQTHIRRQPLPFNAPSADSDLVIPTAGGSAPAYFNFGVSWKEGEGKYKLSKVITITPRYIVKNSLPDAILFREKSVPLHDQSQLDPGQRVPFQTFKNQRDHLFTFAYPGLNTTWSASHYTSVNTAELNTL